MNTTFFIARRYLFAKKSHNVINIISIISAAGIAVGCAALVIILSIYNGFDDLLKGMFESYTPDVVISPRQGKVFTPDPAALQALGSNADVLTVSEVLEETVFLKYGDRDAIVTARGVDSVYQDVTGLSRYVSQGTFDLKDGDIDQMVLGAGIANELRINTSFLTPLEVYFPSRAQRVSQTDPTAVLRKVKLFPAGIISLEKEFDESYVYMPIGTLRELLERTGEVSRLEVRVRPECITASGSISRAFQGEIAAMFGETISTDSNDGSEREATITVTGGAETVTFTIRQEGVSYLFNVTGYENFGNFLSTGESKYFFIESDNVNWKVECNEAWVRISPTEGKSSARISVTADPNPEANEREADIKVTGGTEEVSFTIRQSGSEIKFEVTDYEKFETESFLSIANSKTFSIKSSNVSWSIKCDEKWVRISPTEGNSSATVRITVEENEGDEREANITIEASNGESVIFRIKQDGIVSNFDVTGYENFGLFLATGEERTINISSENVNWELTSNADWVYFTPSSGKSSATVKITVDANPYTEERNATVTASGGSKVVEFTIRQAGKIAGITISGYDKISHFQAKGEDKSFNISIDGDIKWEVTSNATWVSISPSKGDKSADVRITTNPNDSLSPRTATITVKSQNNNDTYAEFQILQLGAADMKIMKAGKELEEMTFAVKAGTGNDRLFMIQTNTKGWKVSTSEDWLKLIDSDEKETTALTGDLDATIHLSAGQNKENIARDAYVIVEFTNGLEEREEKKLHVIQEAYPNIAEISKTMQFIPNSANGIRTNNAEIESEINNPVEISVLPGTLKEQWDYKWTVNGQESSANDSFSFVPTERKAYPVGLTITYKDDPSIVLKDYSYTLYSAPKSPTGLTPKGNGTSNIMIATIDVNEYGLANDEYRFGFKYDEALLTTTSNRYWQYSASQTDDNKKWVYTQWKVGDRDVRSLKEANAAGTTRATTRSESTQDIRAAIGTGFASLSGGRLIAHTESPAKAVISVISTKGMIVKRIELAPRRDYDELIDLSALPTGLYIVRCDIATMRTEEKIVIK